MASDGNSDEARRTEYVPLEGNAGVDVEAIVRNPYAGGKIQIAWIAGSGFVLISSSKMKVKLPLF